MLSAQLQHSRSQVWSWKLSTRDRDSQLHHFRSSLKSSKSTRTRRVRPCMAKVFLECSLRSVKHSYLVRFSQVPELLKISDGVVIDKIILVPTISMSAQHIKSSNLARNSSLPSCQLHKLQLACWQQETRNSIKRPAIFTYSRNKIAQVSFLEVQKTQRQLISRMCKSKPKRVKWKIQLSNR